MSREHAAFLARAAVKAADEDHRLKILRATSTYDAAVAAMKSPATGQFADWQSARALAATIKDDALARLPELLARFEERIAARGATVLWAEDAGEARRHVIDIVRRHRVRKAVKTKSMTTEEIELNALLEGAGVELWETDLGELIVQLAGERPYHIVTPAMHRSRDEIAALFHERLGSPRDAGAEELTMAARRHLRQAYVTADLGISGANFLLADEGAVVMTENEGNGRLTMACPPVHVVVAGIEKVLPRLEDLALFLPLLATSGTGQQLTCYNSIVRGPRGEGEPDGPERMYVILLDNGRSALHADAALRQSLRCIRCGACLNACPVFRTAGGHAYNTAYPGPIGAVITPPLRGLTEWSHLAFASSLCGACTEVCPVGIDLHHLLLENRAGAVQAGGAALRWKLAMRLWAWAMSRRGRLDLLRPLARPALALLRLLMPRRLRARVPALAPRSFSRLWRARR
jgi:L-lactate dehydrogenase complex protein LldF